MTTRHLIKIGAAWLLFVAFHYSYKIWPIGPFQLLGCPCESVFSHMKMAFFSYGLVCGIEWGWSRVRGRSTPSGLYARMLSTLFYSFLVFLLWYVVPSFAGMIHSVRLEIAYSNVVLVICLLCTVVIESALDGAPMRWPQKMVSAGLFLVALVLYTVLAFKDPPTDVFQVHVHGGDGEHHENHEHHDATSH